MDKSRNLSFDVLRIIAAFSVVMLHVSSRYIMMSDVNDAIFTAANFYDSIHRFGVPIFVMISGAIFLSPEHTEDMKKLWLHNILRIFVVYIVWSYAYYVYQSIYIWHFDFFHQSLFRTFTGIVYGAEHLWFLGMIMGLYALVPIIKTWLSKASKQNEEYFLLLFVIFEVARTSVTILVGSTLIEKFAGLFTYAELTGYLGYFVLGHYLTKYEVPKNMRYCVYATLPIDIGLNYFVSWRLSQIDGAYNPGIYDSFGMFTFLEVTALFMMVVYSHKGKEQRKIVHRIVKNISMDTFGVYLMHIMILDILYYEGILEMATPSVIWEIPIALGIFAVSAIVAGLLRRIPFIGRYIC